MVDTTAMDFTAVDTDTVTDTVLDTADTMVDTTAMDFTVADTDTDTTLARGLLMPNLRQMPKLESHSTAMLTVSILMVSVPMVPILMLTVDTMVDTTAVDTDTVVDTSTVNLNIKWLYNSVATRGLEPLTPPQMSSRVLDFVKI